MTALREKSKCKYCHQTILFGTDKVWRANAFFSTGINGHCCPSNFGKSHEPRR